jgi:hypothetical protein
MESIAASFFEFLGDSIVEPFLSYMRLTFNSLLSLVPIRVMDCLSTSSYRYMTF